MGVNMLNNDEIRYRVENFVNKHKSDKNERSEAQSYWKDFLICRVLELGV